MKALIITDFHRGVNPNIAIIQEKEYSSIDQSLFDVIIVSGDWGTSSIDHVKGAFKFLRKTFPNKIICGILGNHDLWDKKLQGLHNRFKKIDEYANQYSIKLLENNFFDFNNYRLLGFNGWYKTYDFSYMNDFNWMPCRTLDEKKDWCRILLDREEKAIQYIEKNHSKELKNIIVSHFPVISSVVQLEEKYNYEINDSIGNRILNIANYYIFGHTHDFCHVKKENTIILNSSADYGKIAYIIYDFDSNLLILDKSFK